MSLNLKSFNHKCMGLSKKFIFSFLLLICSPIFFSDRVYASVQSAATDPDINITLRGNSKVNPPYPNPDTNIGNQADLNADKVLIDIGGETDPKAPQLGTITGNAISNPSIKELYQIKDYNGAAIIPPDYSNNWGVTLMTWLNAGQAIKVPQSGYDIGEGYQAVILYAAKDQITISYTNGGDGIVRGYTIHVINFPKIDPNLVSMYEQYISQGKVIELPCGYTLGTSNGSELVSIRDTGSFMDPRSKKDWWNQSAQLLACDLSLKPKAITIGQSSGAAKNQATLTKSSKPIPDPYVSGGDTRGNEFHQLRPYQASPYGMLYQYIEWDSLFCGNDLVVKHSYTLNPDGPWRTAKACTDDGGENKTCEFQVISDSANIEVDLKDSELPILGNTTLVPNRINEVNLLDDASRVNNYLEWFLNGSVFSSYDTPLTNTVADIDRLINFSGPLNKLLPTTILDFNRGQTADQTQYRHNQIYECFFGGNPTSCVKGAVSLAARLKPESDSSVGADPPLGRSPYSPLAPTEDRAGEVRIPSPQEMTPNDKPVQPLVGGIQVQEVSFTPNSGISESVPDTNNPTGGNITARNDLYFSHTVDGAQLSELLQKTFLYQGTTGFNGDTGADAPYFNSNGGGPKSCEIADAKTNPGDDLFGDLHQQTAPNVGSKYYKNITGKVTYTTLPFNVTFSPSETTDQTCLQTCTTDLSCQACTTTTYSKKVNVYAALAVYTKSPNLNEIADRLVGGDWSVLKRFFPIDILTAKNPKNPKEDLIKDYAASAKATYKEPAGADDPNVEILAGDPTQGRGGEQAQIFFPHLGSVNENFLKGLQCALRPKGMCESAALQVNAAQPGKSGSCQINCNQNAQLTAAAQKYASLKAKFVDLAARWTGDGKPYADECFNDVVNRSVAAGVNPAFTLTEWLHESDASNYTAHNTSCATQDFGINSTTNPIPADFDAQITRFLKLPSDYKTKYPQCFNNGYSDMQNFMQIYKNGVVSPCVPGADAINYLNEIISSAWEPLVPSCPFPTYPTDKPFCP